MADCQILFQDDAMLVLGKPAGMIVNRADTVKGETVQDWLERTIPECSHLTATPDHQDFIQRTGTVHRIDKETSGILLVAKTEAAFLELQRQFKERIVHKKYLAYVHGKLTPSSGIVNAPVGRLPWNREQFGVVPGGKESVTAYASTHIYHFQPPDRHDPLVLFSSVELEPETGRTHQIRVHMKYIGHPLLGDYLYAGRKTSRNDRVWAPRVMLHAWKLTCLHPTTQESISFTAPIPEDMEYLVQSSQEVS